MKTKKNLYSILSKSIIHAVDIKLLMYLSNVGLFRIQRAGNWHSVMSRPRTGGAYVNSDGKPAVDSAVNIVAVGLGSRPRED